MALQPRRKSNKYKGLKFEDKVKKSIGSGNLWFSPLDIQYDHYCIEAKYTDGNGYRVSLDLLEKIWGKALSMQKEPCLVIGIKRNDKEMFILRCPVTIEKRQGVSDV